MSSSSFVFAFFIIFFGASLLATAALYTRQSLLVAYLVLGVIVGPWGLKLIPQTHVIAEISDIGIMFLLFLLGLNMRFSNLLDMLRGATIVTCVSALVFSAVLMLVMHLFGFAWIDSILVGIALMFSSTIVGLKLLPTTALHHQHIGEVMVSILLFQDVIAIIVLLVLGIGGVGGHQLSWWHAVRSIIAFPLLVAFAYVSERYVLYRLFRRFDRIQEYLFLITIGWCLCLAQIAHWSGLSYEIGAFIAGVSLAASPISQFIAESLKPLRDFFLIIFFFSVGASFHYQGMVDVIWPVLALLLLVIILKPVTFFLLLRSVDESPKRAWEAGVRLGQASEFSLLVAVLALQAELLSQSAYVVIQGVTILSFIISSYWVVMSYPSPMSLTKKLRRD